MKVKIAIGILTALVILLFGWFVWPTKYQYVDVRSGAYQGTLRRNRVTGETCWFDIDHMHWMKKDPEAEFFSQYRTPSEKSDSLPPPRPLRVLTPCEE